jgi:hypothetical protein
LSGIKLLTRCLQQIILIAKPTAVKIEPSQDLSLKRSLSEALCKKLREDTQRSEEEKATLEGMAESHDELLMEIARATGLDHMGEDDDDEEEEEDANDREVAAAPPPHAPPTVTPEEINDEGPVEVIPEQEALVPHEVVLADVESEMPQLCLYHALMMDYEENPLRMEDDFDDLDDDPNEGRSDMDEWFSKDGSNDRD